MVKLETFATNFKKALEKNECVVFFCECVVNYSGRAESHLPKGQRIIIVKADKTLIVHQPNGNNPVNYLKSNSSYSVLVMDDVVIMRCKNGKEFLSVEISNVFSMNSQLLEDTEKIRVVGTEKDMAEYILQNPKVIDEDFKPLSMEEHTKFGFIDVFGYDKDNVLVVVECKRYVGDLKAVSQLRRYVEKVKDTKGLDVVRGILACPRMSANALEMLEKWGFKHVSVSPPKYLEKFDKFQTKLS